ncbi:monocarboxylate transporter 14 [Plakobranchus ocellatus]|uniref:Monocarboxylate transporter 14 n=1 Tax=Plakobranchus ocellatus TaxID=259542 RepID=A0AAV3Y2A7_9GAST|nr:monocarboxylate transporter 14 [Plakobranchus ocellatus]
MSMATSPKVSEPRIHSRSRSASLKATYDAETLLLALSQASIKREKEDKVCDRPDSPVAFRAHFRGLDGGYGWFVILGSFMSHLIEGGFERGEGIFFLHFLERFGQSNQLTALPGALASTLRFLLSPVASMVCNRYSVRASVMFGASIFASGVFLTQFVENFYLLFITYALLTGCGRAFFSGPSLIVIGLYFRKRQGLATGLAVSGVGLGAFFLVPLEQYLFQNFSFQGAFLILSAVASHMLLVAMIYRPISTNNHYLASNAKKRMTQYLAERRSEGQLKGTNIDSDTLDHFQEVMRRENAITTTESEEQMSLPFKITNNGVVVTPVFHHDCDPHPRSVSNKIRNIVCGNCCCEICFPVEEFNTTPDAESSKIFQFHLLRDKGFLFYCLATFMFSGCVKIVYVFLPTLVEAKGFSGNDAAAILSVVGPIDTFTRICIGVVMDLGFVKPYRLLLFNIFLVILAMCSVLLPNLNGLDEITLAMAVYSVSAGLCFASRTVVLVDLVGDHLLASSFGVLMFFQGIGALLGPPLSGFLLDVYSTIKYSYYLAAAVATTSAAFMGTSVICR